MNRLFDELRPFIRTVIRQAGWVLVVAVLMSGVGLYFASGLSIDTDFSKLIPEDRASVQALETLRQTVGGESDVAVGIVSPSFEANKAFAEDLIPEAMNLQPKSGNESYFTRVEYRREIEFLQNNALYFASDNELATVDTFLQDQIEEAKLKANPFYASLDDGESETDSVGQELEQVYDRLVGKRYPVSDDSTTMVVRFYPSSTNTNIGFIDNLYANLRSQVDALDPASYHPDMEIVLAGRLYRQLVEVQTIQQDVLNSFGSGAGAVLLFVVLYFLYKSFRAQSGSALHWRRLPKELVRAPVMALIIGVPLVMSLLWTGGFAELVFGELNLMTSTLGLILFGLGIDFGIHFYGRYAEERAEGQSITDAAEVTFMSTGQAIAVGALTTASALYVLTVADFKGFSEFGAIAGTGILFALVAMTVVLPALVALFERLGWIDLRAATGVPVAANGPSGRRYPAARPIVLGSVIAVVAAIGLLPRVGFQYDFGELEPEYEAYDEKDRVVDRVGQSGGARRNPAYVIADSPEDVPEIVEAVETKMQADTSTIILAVESLQERFPLADSAKQSKLERVAQIRKTITESKYLMDDGEPRSDDIARLLRAAQTAAPVSIDQVPDFLREKFTTKDGQIGNFVMIYPSRSLADGRNSIAFKNAVGTITTDEGTTYHAGSTSIVAADMLVIMRGEAPWMVAATFVIVALLMMLNFRSVRWTALALVPLVIGVLWMLLAMEVFGLMLNFYNMIVLPAVVGIGNDAGVHLAHRYREEGDGSIWRVLRSTGEHVTMGSLTTMMGFGGLLLSFHPGLRSIGILAVVGIGATLLSAIVFLPALLQWLEDRNATPPRQDVDGPTSETPEPMPADLSSA
jgi:predicted RND superfamily exporter protein